MALIKINNRSSEDNAIHGRRNLFWNGDFRIAQRGTSFTSGTYLLDRWKIYNGGGTFTVSQQSFSAGESLADGKIHNYCRIVRSSPSSTFFFSQRIEDVRLTDGVSMTLSFYAKASGAVTIPVRITQEFGSGGSSGVNITAQDVDLTTSWQRFELTFNMASLSGKTIGSSNYFEPVLDIPATTETIDVTGFQCEVGTKATPYEYRTFSEELAGCQRYFFTTMKAPNGGAQSRPLGFSGIGRGNYAIHVSTGRFPVTMRANPTITAYAFGYYADFSTFGDSRTGVLVAYDPSNIRYVNHTNGLSFHANNHGILIANNGENTSNTTVYQCGFDASAEL